MAFLGFGFLLLFISVTIRKSGLADFSVCLIIVGFLVLIISLIYQIVKRKWPSVIFTVISFCFYSIVLCYSMIFLYYFYQSTDNYADNLEIPKNIHFEKPMDEMTRNSDVKIQKNNEFKIYNSFQPGLYDYDIWLKKIDSGIVYIKAYEITKNDQLSKDRLKQRSSLQVVNTSDSIKRFSTANHFTIYEGDWGKPYGCRFEVWFKSDNGKERKLNEKNYIIEGWQR